MRRRARVVGIAAAISIAAAAVPGAVGADQTACQPGSGSVGGDPSTAGGVNIHLTANGSTTWCSAQVIETGSDVADGTNYPVRATTESPSTNPVSNAISLGKLLSIAGVDPATVNHTEIMRLSGTFSMLDHADVVDPSARFVGGLTPIFWINGSETQYLRPLRGPADTNGADQIVASDGSPLDLFVYSGPLLTVTGAAAPKHVAVRQRVTFTAQVSNPRPADGTLVYNWNFQDGTTATGATVTHRYAVAGNWYPVVTARGRANDSGGASQPVHVTVGAPPKGAGSGAPGGGSHNKRAPAGGPTHSNGKRANTSPTHGRTSGSDANTGAAPSQSPRGQTPNTTTSPPGPSARGASRTHAPPARAANPHQVNRRTRSLLGPGATVVQGRLIADIVPVSASQLTSATGPADPAHAPSARIGGASPSPLGGVAGAGAIVLLLGLGAATERRGQRRSRTPSRTA